MPLVFISFQFLKFYFSHVSGTSSLTPVIAQIALEKLCPAVYALLSDGLHPSLHSLFGKISNSVWRVIEATSQMGKINFNIFKLIEFLVKIFEKLFVK